MRTACSGRRRHERRHSLLLSRRPKPSDLDQFAPWWVYEGDARIQRRIASFTLSRGHEKYERLLDALPLYRLILGQPRQEEMARLMQQGEMGRDLAVGAINLRPPTRHV